MSTSVIDAFVMTLGLDPSGFKRGKAEADSAIRDTKNIALVSASEISGAVGKLALEFSGLFLAVRGISDIVHFFTDLNHEIADLGYTSRQLGETASNLRLYQQVSEGFGGTAKGVNDTVSSLETALFNMRQMGQFSDTLMAWQRFGGGLPPVNAQGGIDYLKMVQQARGAMHGLSSVEANQRMMAMGLDEGTRNAIMSSTTEFNKWVEAQRKSAAQFAQDTLGAQRLSRSWQQLKNDTQGLAATLLKDATPAIQQIFKDLDKWFKSDGPEHFREGIDKIITTVQNLIDTLSKLEGMTPGGAAQGAWDWFKGGFKNPFGAQAGKDDPLGKYESSSYWQGRFRSSLAPTLSALEGKYGLPKGLLDKVISAESNYNIGAVSKTGNVGIMQLDPNTFKGAGTNYRADIETGAAYLAKLHQMFGGDKGDPNWAKAVAAYNADPGTERDVLAEKRKFLPETMDYVPKVLGPNIHAPSAGGSGTNVTIGKIEVHTQATDADGIAADLAGALNRKFNVFQTDAGVA